VAKAQSEFDVKSLAREVQQAISGLKERGEEQSAGIVTRVGDGVAWIYGLRSVGYSEMIEIETIGGGNVTAFALNLLEDEIGAVILGEDQEIKAGARVRLSGKILSVPVGPELVGRVVDPLGRPLDEKGEIKMLDERTHGGSLQDGCSDCPSAHQPLTTSSLSVSA